MTKNGPSNVGIWIILNFFPSTKKWSFKINKMGNLNVYVGKIVYIIHIQEFSKTNELNYHYF